MPRPVEPAAIEGLRDAFASARFTVAGLESLWGVEAGDALHRGERVPALRAIGDSTVPLATLATLFVLGLPASRVAVELALAVEASVVSGLIAVRGDMVVPLVDLRPYAFADDEGAGEWWIASDLGELALGRAIAEDHVLGVGGASLTLAGITVREPVDRALDLGTGCGIQALHARRHARRVVATDVSQRALDFASFNAALNGIDGIEFRLGSLFEPVAGESFDLIVSNPPFVITPRAPGVPNYEYRDGGLVGDALLRRVVRGSAEHLAPGGVLQCLGNWEYDGGDGLERMRALVDPLPVDAWVLEREQQDVGSYAETWIRDGGTRSGTADFDRLYGAWLDDFEARGVRRVGFGYVTLRRTGAPGRRRLERYPDPTAGGLGAAVATTLRAWDDLRAAPNLAGARLVVASDVTEERHYWPGEEHPTVIVLRQGGGFARHHRAGTALAAVVGACDGDLTVRELTAAVASILNVDAGELEDEVLPQLEELIETGFLTVV